MATVLEEESEEESEIEERVESDEDEDESFMESGATMVTDIGGMVQCKTPCITSAYNMSFAR